MLYSWVIALVLAQTVTGDPLAPYRGRPVVAVEIHAPADESVQELEALIGIEPGYLLSGEDVGVALRRLYALGRFADVGVTAERLSGAVSLHFYLRPLRRLDRLEVHGIEAADAGALRSALRIKVGDEVDSRTRESLQARAIAYLRRAGFPRATAEVELAAEAEETPVSLTLNIREDAPIRVSQVRFGGRPRLHHEVLERLVSLHPGAILDLDQVEADAQRLRQAYREHGFLGARVGDPEVRRRGGGADVVFDIEAGDRVVIEVAGSTRLTQEDILGLWPKPTGMLQDGDLRIFADRIAERYRRLGFFEARARAKSARDAAHEVMSYRIEVAPGPLFDVAEVTFSGAETFQPSLLDAQLRAVLRGALGRDRFFERLTGADICLTWGRDGSQAGGSGRGCARSVVPIERRWVPELYEEALAEVAAAYRNLGYLSARVGPATPRFERHRVFVTVPVEEGPQTTVAAVSFHGNEAVPASELLGLVEQATAASEAAVIVRPGAPFSSTALEDGRIAIVRKYRDLGYLYAQVFSEVSLSDDRLSATALYRVEEGPQVRVDRVLVRGNRYTRESVIRSRLSTAPGDLYRLEQALADQRSVAALGVFSSVRVRLIDEERPAERKDLVAEVAERNRQPVELLVGISSAEGPRAAASYSHINVLGTASTFTGSAKLNRQIFFSLYGDFAETMSERYRQFDVFEQLEYELRTGVHSPRLSVLPLDPAARADFVVQRENAIPYSFLSGTAVLGLDLQPLSNLTVSLEPQVSLTNLTCVSNIEGGEGFCLRRALGSRPGVRRLDQGLRRTFKLGPSVTFDSRDNPFNPSRGLFANLKGVYAVGRVQPDPDRDDEEAFSFTKLEGTLTGYIPAGGPVLALSARAGRVFITGGDVPVDERFYLGGRNSLRGFVESALIPEDACVIDAGAAEPAGCEALPRTAEAPPLTKGGDLFMLFKSELRVPLDESFSLGLFVDAGNLWVNLPAPEQLRFRVGGGAGLRYATPVGPLALDVGVNTNPRAVNSEPAAQLHFSVGMF